MTVRAENVTVRFGGVTAVDNVSLTMERGQIVSIVGPNGSGKSTMFNAITGMVRTAAGSIQLDGARIDSRPPHRRIALGLARTFQTPRFDPQITVEEAVMCGFYPRKACSLFASMVRTPAASAEEKTFRERCGSILSDLRLAPFRDLQMSELPMGRVRLVEVARAVANDPKYILLDEPAAGLARDEQKMLAYEVRRLADQGVGVLLVEHNFNLIRELAEHVVVLKEGRMLLEGTPAEIASDRAFIDTYLGRAGQ
ncbi:ABC transporter ATP-binding protein [Pseudohoeflea coraliihabitans]|uniref:ABC transporter ATP-binding protein n=1 Tax=Pseudohoeflea coraliihabitans TaxID=2860393 RepID=A0ABS6WR31_9HYPH|nr:ABC transporter ATP-binding protein [Pseudohoeflea sp. DP4N28-3]MBW3098439.1 ABC transporter ATP-binding protein [Pseudohoeflea sp. DP4N28-3]